MEFANIVLFGREEEPPVKELSKLIKFLESTGRNVLVGKRTAHFLGLEKGYTFKEISQTADLAIVYGGDGTMLSVCRKIAPYKIPVVGINAGHLGFITDIPSESMEKELSDILNSHYYVDKRKLLKGELWRSGKEVFSGTALNEVCVSRGISGGMVEFKASVNHHPITTQRADGIIFSTATGSTAYAMSVGGPLISPTIPCILMIPVAAHSLNNRPVILEEKSLIEIDILDVRDAAFYFDMQEYSIVQQGDKIVISPSEYSLHILHPSSHSFFDTISNKLNWNMMPSLRTKP